MKWLSVLFLLLIALPAAAEEYTYAPENCDFRMVFPSEPQIVRHCNPESPKDCQQVISYTKVYDDLHASIGFEVTCNPINKEAFNQYSGPIMETTLAAMANGRQLEEFQTGFHETADAKQATIIGAGKTGLSDKLYVGQLWIGHNSLMTVESELVGAASEKAHAEYADILRTIRHKNWKPQEGSGADAPVAESKEQSGAGAAGK